MKRDIEKQKSPIKESLQKVRKMSKKTLSSCDKNDGGVTTFAVNKRYITAMKRCVHVSFAITALNKNWNLNSMCSVETSSGLNY